MPQKECKNSHNIVFTLQYKHYLWTACSEKWSSQASVNSGELPVQNSSCLRRHLSCRSNASPQIQGMVRQGLACWSSKLLALVIPA